MMSAASASPIAQRLASLHGRPLAAPLAMSGAGLRSRHPATVAANVIDLLRRTGGAEVAPGLIEVVREWPLALRLPGRDLRRLAAPLETGSERIGPRDWCVLDTETVELPGSSGTVAFVIGVARVRGACLETRQWLLASLAAEAAMLERLQLALDEATTLVSFNGKNYDLPLLRKRFQLTGLPALREPETHLALLFRARHAWREQYPDGRLATLERHVLGHVRHEDRLEAAQAWIQWLEQRDALSLARVLAHNGQDLISIAGLFARLCEGFAGHAKVAAAA